MAINATIHVDLCVKQQLIDSTGQRSVSEVFSSRGDVMYCL